MATGHDTTDVTISQPYTDEQFEHLKHMRKQVKNPGARWGERPKSHIGHKLAWFAEETDRFETVEGALACLMEDYSLSGISGIEHDHPRLGL